MESGGPRGGAQSRDSGLVGRTELSRHWRTVKADGELWGVRVRSRTLEVSGLGAWEAGGASAGAERAWRGNSGLPRGGDSVRVQLWEVAVLRAPPLHPRGSSPPCSQRSHRPSCRPPLLSDGLPGSGSTGAVPAPLYKAPADPFGKRISFFLDAFPDLGVMEGLSAARARARLREEEPGSWGPQPHAAAGTKAPLLEPWPPSPVGQAHNLRPGPSDCSLLLPQIRSEKVSSRRGRARGGGR